MHSGQRRRSPTGQSGTLQSPGAVEARRTRDLHRDRYGWAQDPAFYLLLSYDFARRSSQTPDKGHVMSGPRQWLPSFFWFSRLRRAKKLSPWAPVRMWIGYALRVWLLAGNSQLVKLHVLNQKPHDAHLSSDGAIPRSQRQRNPPRLPGRQMIFSLSVVSFFLVV